MTAFLPDSWEHEFLETLRVGIRLELAHRDAVARIRRWLFDPPRVVAYSEGALTRCVRGWSLDTGHLPAPAVPFGWACWRSTNRDLYILAPWWAPANLVRCWWWYIVAPVCGFAITVGAATAPYEGCYYSELEWFGGSRCKP